jgi:hypothetical protein
MKKYKSLFLFVLLTAFAVPNAVAQSCPTAPTGPHEAGGRHWFEWSPDPGCLYTNNMSSTTLSCYSFGAYAPALQQPAFVRYTFTADQVYSNWSADAFIDFDDPNNSSSNWVDAWAHVDHNGVNTSYHLFSQNGSSGDWSCERPGGTFSAADGDFVTVELSAYRANSNTTIKIGYPHIFNTQ